MILFNLDELLKVKESLLNVIDVQQITFMHIKALQKKYYFLIIFAASCKLTFFTVH